MNNLLYKVYTSNIKYFMLPIVYFIIIVSLVPTTNMDVVKYSYISLDSYRSIAVTREEKIDYILKNYNLTKEEFKVVAAVVLSEAESNSYEDAYAVINTIYNRTHSKNWVNSMNKRYGKGKGNSLYYQVIAPKQFTVYKSGAYKRYLNNTTSVGYDAIIDFLYTEKTMHDYLSFRSHSIKIKNSESFSNKGNNYFNVMKEENRV